MQVFRNLKVWWRSHRLTLDVYETTAGFPGNDMYDLTPQPRRSCASGSANIAEGCGRSDNAELSRSLQSATGSASELEYHLLLARDLNYSKSKDHERLSNEAKDLKRMLSTLITKLRPT